MPTSASPVQVGRSRLSKRRKKQRRRRSQARYRRRTLVNLYNILWNLSVKWVKAVRRRRWSIALMKGCGVIRIKKGRGWVRWAPINSGLFLSSYLCVLSRHITWVCLLRCSSGETVTCLYCKIRSSKVSGHLWVRSLSHIMRVSRLRYYIIDMRWRNGFPSKLDRPKIPFKFRKTG